MSYLVFCTFDLKGASKKDYDHAYSDLSDLGLEKVHKGSKGGDVVIPTTSVMGEYAGTSASEVRDAVRARIKAVFSARRFKSEIFVIVGGDWGWGVTTT
ncbi:hypothetical protein [Xanthomonas campestris]|uniref:hypothetical protein n=1 Tax=Xanthomonas TaxID=338 RepID=UPI001E618499|nr:hypothetical protein [Xanthomonas campestris]MCC5090608.1 hypothetical protein [Xanthomonas campestris]